MADMVEFARIIIEMTLFETLKKGDLSDVTKVYDSSPEDPDISQKLRYMIEPKLSKKDLKEIKDLLWRYALNHVNFVDILANTRGRVE
jgi:hypothetical protein